MTKQEKMYAIVSGYDEHTMDRKTYSTEQGITLNMFCYWRGKWLKEQRSGATKKSLPPKASSLAQSSPAFEPFSVDMPSTGKVSANAESFYEIIYPNGVRFRLPQLDLPLIKKLIDLYV